MMFLFDYNIHLPIMPKETLVKILCHELHVAICSLSLL